MNKKHDPQWILDNFNFDKVHDYMVKTNWTWATNDGGNEIPTVDQLKMKAQYVLTGVLNNGRDNGNYGTGGLTAYKFDWGLKLSFEPFTYSTF